MFLQADIRRQSIDVLCVTICDAGSATRMSAKFSRLLEPSERPCMLGRDREVKNGLTLEFLTATRLMSGVKYLEFGHFKASPAASLLPPLTRALIGYGLFLFTATCLTIATIPQRSTVHGVSLR